MSMRMQSFNQDNAWLGSWTVFYWSWWIAWCPYVGLFIARISRGRTIREFVLGTVIGPSVVTFVWMAVFGGSAIQLDRTQGGGIARSEEHTSELQSRQYLVCRLLLEKKKK